MYTSPWTFIHREKKKKKKKNVTTSERKQLWWRRSINLDEISKKKKWKRIMSIGINESLIKYNRRDIHTRTIFLLLSSTQLCSRESMQTDAFCFKVEERFSVFFQVYWIIYSYLLSTIEIVCLILIFVLN
jgi:hypothetical protein